MNEIITAMLERRTIRKFTEQPVPDATLLQLYEVISSTQSWANTQCWEIVNVVNPDTRNRLQATLPQQNPAYRTVVSAPILLAVCARMGTSGMIGASMGSKHGDWYMYDLGIATQNLCLAAHSLGRGTVVVGWFDHDKAHAILNVPIGIEVVSLIPMGYPNQKGVVPPHKAVDAFVHVDTF